MTQCVAKALTLALSETLIQRRNTGCVGQKPKRVCAGATPFVGVGPTIVGKRLSSERVMTRDLVAASERGQGGSLSLASGLSKGAATLKDAAFLRAP